MFCLLVSPDPLRRALMRLSDSEPLGPGQAAAVVVVAGVPPATPPARAAADTHHHHVTVDISDNDDEETGQQQQQQQHRYISPVCRVLVKAVFLVYATFVAPPLVETAATRSTSFLQAMLVVVPALLTAVALFMATLRVVEAEEDRERAAAMDDDSQDGHDDDVIKPLRNEI